MHDGGICLCVLRNGQIADFSLNQNILVFFSGQSACDTVIPSQTPFVVGVGRAFLGVRLIFQPAENDFQMRTF